MAKNSGFGKNTQTTLKGTKGNDVLVAGSDTTLIRGRAGDDTIDGGDQGLRARGGRGDDVISGGAGNDTIIGGAGHDTAVFGGSILGYTWTQGRGKTWTVSGQDGVDTLRKIEVLRFDDFSLNIDGTNNRAYTRADSAATGEDGTVIVAVLANDIDFDGDTLTVTGASSDTLGVTVTVNPDNTVGYGPGSAFQHLAAGETATDTVTYTVDDGRGGTATGTLVVTITGANDGPVITAADTAGAVQELAAADPVANSTTLTDSGVISFADVDLSDGHTVSVVDGGTGYLGSFTATVSDPATGDGSGAVTWTFAVDDAALDFLQADETLVQSYDVTIDDGKGGTVTETVSVTLTGAADPVANPGIVIDFDSGSNTVTSGGETGYKYGIYKQDGFTFSWAGYENNLSGENYPFRDIDGDGSLEFAGISDAAVYNSYSGGYGFLTRDDGQSFSLLDFDLVNEGGGDPHSNLFFMHNIYPQAAALALVYDGSGAWWLQTYDPSTGNWLSTSSATKAEVLAALGQMTELRIDIFAYNPGSGSGNGFGIDNLLVA